MPTTKATIDARRGVLPSPFKLVEFRHGNSSNAWARARGLTQAATETARARKGSKEEETQRVIFLLYEMGQGCLIKVGLNAI